MCLAKGLTGGYVPLAATLTTGDVYDAFRGDPENAFYYGHSFTANPIGCAAALASLDVFEEEQILVGLESKIERMAKLLEGLRLESRWVHEIRQCGLVAGIELRQRDGSRFAESEHVGQRVSMVARDHELLSRPIRDTLVLLPPLSITLDELEFAVDAFEKAIVGVLD